MKNPIIPMVIAAFGLPTLAHAQGANQTLILSPRSSVTDDGAGDDPATLTHEGFMLRMIGGFALLGAGLEPEQRIELGAGGGGQAFSLSVGGYIVPNLALHGDLLAASADHTVTANDDDTSRGHAEDFALGAAGVGLTYYVMPYNLSFTGSLLIGEMNLEPEVGPTYRTDYAVFGKFGLAKQWAISDYWGLGVGASAWLGYGRGEDSDDEDFETGLGGLSIDLVATYD